MRIRVDHCKCPTYMGNLLACDLSIKIRVKYAKFIEHAL